MARPMRTPVKWDRGSVSVAPIAQPFKGILEGFGIDESDYSAEGGFGESGLLDWEPAEFISPDVVWGTQYVSGAPPHPIIRMVMTMIMVRINVLMARGLMEHVSQSQMMAVMQDITKRVEFVLKM